MSAFKVLGLAGLLGIAGCTTTVTEPKMNPLSSRQWEQLVAAHHYAAQPRTNEVTKLRLTALSPEQMLQYVDFPRATYTTYTLPAGNSTNELWEGNVDTTASAINQSIPTLERIARELPSSGRVSRLVFPDKYATIGQKSGLLAVELYHTGTNDALGVKINRTTYIKQGKDTERYTFSITTGVPSTRIQSTDHNTLALINVAEATGIGMAIVPLEGGIFGAGQAMREGMFYWNTRNPAVTKTKVYTISDLDTKHARVRALTETAQTLNAQKVYIHHTPAGTLVVYGHDTKHPLAGPNTEAKLPAHTFLAEREESIRSHYGALFWRALEVWVSAGALRAFPHEKKIIQTITAPTSTGVTGGSTGGAGGR